MKHKLIYLGIQLICALISWAMWQSDITPLMPSEYWWHSLAVRIGYVLIIQFCGYAATWAALVMAPRFRRLPEHLQIKAVAFALGVVVVFAVLNFSFGYVNDNYLHWYYTDYSTEFNHVIEGVLPQ